MRIAIDDFGTGYSSFAYLRQFPVDALKIDRSFISGVAASNHSKALIHTLVQLGKTLGLQTLGEGIEDDAQLEHLRREQCDLGQGVPVRSPARSRWHRAALGHWHCARRYAADPHGARRSERGGVAMPRRSTRQHGRSRRPVTARAERQRALDGPPR